MRKCPKKSYLKSQKPLVCVFFKFSSVSILLLNLLRMNLKHTLHWKSWILSEPRETKANNLNFREKPGTTEGLWGNQWRRKAETLQKGFRQPEVQRVRGSCRWKWGLEFTWRRAGDSLQRSKTNEARTCWQPWESNLGLRILSYKNGKARLDVL